MSSDTLGYLASQVCSFSDKRWGFNDVLLVCWLDPTIPLGHPKDYGQPAIWYNSAKWNNRTNVAAFFKLNEKSDFGYYGNGHENEIELQRWYSYSVSSLRQNGKVSRVLILSSNWIYVSSRYFQVYMEVKLDGRTIFMKENNSSTRYTNMQAMFQGRGQYPFSDVSIKNIFLKSFNF